MRAEMCKQMEWAGVKIDPAKNKAAVLGELGWCCGGGPGLGGLGVFDHGRVSRWGCHDRALRRARLRCWVRRLALTPTLGGAG